MNKKKLFVGCSVALGVAVILIITGAFFAYKYLVSPVLSARTKMPEELKAPRVLTGSDFLSKEIFVQNSKLGTITDIAFGEFDPTPDAYSGRKGSGIPEEKDHPLRGNPIRDSGVIRSWVACRGAWQDAG